MSLKKIAAVRRGRKLPGGAGVRSLRGLLVGSAILVMCSALAGAASGRAGAGSSGEASGSGLASPKAVVREVRTLESDRIGTTSPVGLAFASSSESFYLTKRSPSRWPHRTRQSPDSSPSPCAGTRIASARPRSPQASATGSTSRSTTVRDRLLLLREDGRRLFAIQANADGSLDPTTLVHYDVSRFGLGDPEGMAVDPASGAIFILDASGPRIVRLEPGSDGGFADAEVSSIDLAPSGASERARDRLRSFERSSSRRC